MNNKEKRNIYNVSFNDKKATPIKNDVELVEDIVIEYIAMYVKGYHNIKRNKGRGAEHIKLHLEDNAEGEISIKELLNLGNSLRNYLNVFEKPFIDSNGAKIYEWKNDDGISFRVVVDKVKGEGLHIPPLSSFDDVDGQGHTSTTFHPTTDQIISFYSDRNLNEKMQFKNPEVQKYYSKLTIERLKANKTEWQIVLAYCIQKTGTKYKYINDAFDDMIKYQEEAWKNKDSIKQEYLDKAKTMINNCINKELKNLEQEYNETNTENENTSKEEHKPHKRRR